MASGFPCPPFDSLDRLAGWPAGRLDCLVVSQALATMGSSNRLLCSPVVVIAVVVRKLY